MRISKGDIAKADLACRHSLGGSIARGERAVLLHARFEAKDCRNRRARAVQRPGQSAESNHARADCGASKRDEPCEREMAVQSGCAHGPEHNDVCSQYKQYAPNERTLSQTR